MIAVNILTLLLTTFISVNGQIMEVSAAEATSYEETVVTDIGNPDNLNTTETESAQSTETTETESTETTETETTETPTTIIVQDNSEVVALLSEQVELLSENSSSVTGTVNSTVLTLMDRMVDSYPDFYEYAGFRTNEDDSYASTLYIAKKATSDGNTITFSEDCKAVYFYRTTTSTYNGYLYYTVADAPNATLDVTSNSIVYTNVLEGYPTLGTKPQFPTAYVWVIIFAVLFIGIMIRRGNAN